MQEIATRLLTFVRDDLLIMGSIGAGCVIMASCLEKRSHFSLRVILSFFIVCIWMIGTEAFRQHWTGNWMVIGTVRYTGVFLLFAVSVGFWSKASFCQALFAITVSYSLQNMCERIIEIPRVSLQNFPVLLDRFCLFVMLTSCLLLFYRLFIADSKSKTVFDFSHLSKRVMLTLGAGVVAVSVVLDIFIRSNLPHDNIVMVNCASIMSGVFSLLTVVLCVSHMRETESEKRANVAAQLLRSQQYRYEQDKLVHDAINIKCHDIRHQIAALGDGAYGVELKKIGKLVDVYDATPRSQCAALDVVLASKSLYCGTKSVTLTCLVDGRRLGFMEDCDIYALFSNILDNAIEAAEQVEDQEKRLVSLTVRTRDELLLIEEENFYKGDLSFEEGLPVTTKADRDNHGFGTRSIQILTKKYGGDLKLDARDGIFHLSILLPIPG